MIYITLLVVLIAFYVFINVREPSIIVGPRKGPNAQNNVFRIYLADDLGENLLPILAQEYYEARAKAKNPLIKLIPAWHRNMEIMGHEIEVQAAEKLNKAPSIPRRKSEAYALTKYRQFKGVPQSNIYNRMLSQSSKARHWFEANEAKLRGRLG